MIKLSICIPTYNFADFIGDTLDSIVKQMKEGVEVLVVDGASTDNTAEIVARYSAKFPNVKYHLLAQKGGIDVDMARSVELANGEFCWLFSSDDIMDAEAIERVMPRLDEGLDVLLCSHTDCTVDMEPFQRHPVLAVSTDRDYNFQHGGDLAAYFDAAITTEPFFSFMSGLIIRKSYWDTVTINPDFVGSCWAHAARLFEINRDRPLRIRHVYEPLLHRRGDNDSFASNGLVNRYAIAINGYNKIANTFFGRDSREAWNIRRVLRNEYSLKSFLYAKHLAYNNPEREDPALLNALVEDFYCEGSLAHGVNKFIYRAVSRTPLALMIRTYQFAASLSGK